MNRNGRDNLILRGIDHAHRSVPGHTSGIDDINLVPDRIHRNARRLLPHRKHAVQSELHQVQHGDSIAPAVGHIRVFPKVRRILRKVVTPASTQKDGQRKRYSEKAARERPPFPVPSLYLLCQDRPCARVYAFALVTVSVSSIPCGILRRSTVAIWLHSSISCTNCSG